jgi:HSP20 family molecular chaperone IbpA
VEEQQEAHLMEIAYSRFERSVDLPEPLGRVEPRIEYRDGMLLVHLAVKATP